MKIATPDLNIVILAPCHSDDPGAFKLVSQSIEHVRAMRELGIVGERVCAAELRAGHILFMTDDVVPNVENDSALTVRLDGEGQQHCGRFTIRPKWVAVSLAEYYRVIIGRLCL